MVEPARYSDTMIDRLLFAPLFALLFALLLLPVFLAATPAAAQPIRQPQETAEQRDARMAWWREARFGLFIHWGIYSVPAGQYEGNEVPGIGEWIQLRAQIPVDRYAEYAKDFNPTSFDPDAWATMAKNAGMKYLVITSKHHDGFALFDSAASDFDVVDATPYDKDIIKQLSEACAKQGIKFGLYYSQCQDWHHPGGAAYAEHWDEKQNGDFDQYLDTVAIPQLREILNNYGELAVIWFDTPTDAMTPERAQRVLDELENHPNLIVNNRLGGGFAGDTETPEQFIPATGYPGGRDWETCMTMNDTWGYKSSDNNWKSTETLIRNLIDIASKGGNYLLNVGPKPDGTWPQESIDRLAEIGQWMNTHGEAIYGTTASPFRKLPFNGRATVKGNDLYLHVFDWSGAIVTLAGLENEVQSATAVGSGQALRVIIENPESGPALMAIEKPEAANPIATVIKLTLDGPPKVDPSIYAVRPAADGSLTLTAGDAFPTGSIQYEADKNCLGYWTDASSTVSFELQGVVAGRYTIEVTYACAPGSEGSIVAIEVGDVKTELKVNATADWVDFVTVPAGEIDLAEGAAQLVVRPTAKPGLAVMNLRSIRLVPTH